MAAFSSLIHFYDAHLLHTTLQYFTADKTEGGQLLLVRKNILFSLPNVKFQLLLLDQYILLPVMALGPVSLV